MTGYTVHTGATEKFVEGWDHIFKKTSAKGGAKTRKRTTKKGKPAAKARRARSGKKKARK
jgi:hypothetical protein